MQNRDIDLIIYDKRGEAVLLALVKALIGKSAQWASQSRNNLLSHGTLPRAPYFLLATPDRLYFWKQNHSGNFEELPDFTMDAAKEFKSSFEKLKRAPNEIGDQTHEFILIPWLSDLGRIITPRLKQDPALQWLFESGLANLLEGSRLDIAVA